MPIHDLPRPPARRPSIRVRLLACALGLALAACSGQKQPAAAQLGAIRAAIEAAQPDAGRYVPRELASVQSRLAALEQRYAAADYRDVVDHSPEVLASALQLVGAAAARRAEVTAQLRLQWPAVADSLPQWLEGLQKRAEVLGHARRQGHGVDLAAGTAALAEARTLWGQALAAFAAGNLEEALATAGRARERAAAAATALGMPPPA